MLGKFSITVFYILSVQQFFAQTIDKHNITLDQCIQLALKSNPGLLANELETNISEKQVEIQKGKFLPSISLSSEYMFTDQYRELDDYQVANANLQVYIPIWQNGINRVGIKQSELGYDATLANFKIYQSNLVYNVNETFINVLRLKKLSKLANDMSKRFAITVDAANERFKVGISRRSDLLKAQTEYSNSIYLTIQLETSNNKAFRSLLKISGLQLDSNIIITDSLVDHSDWLELLSLDSLYSLANQYLPEFQLIRKKIEQQELSVLIECKRSYPKIGAFGSLNYLKTPVYESDIYSNTGITLKLDIFSGGRKKNQVVIEKIKTNQLNLEQKETVRMVYTDIHIAWLNLSEAREKIINAKFQLESSYESLQTINQQYLSGLSSMLELIDAQYADFTANQNYINALADYYLAIASLKRKTGLMTYQYCN